MFRFEDPIYLWLLCLIPLTALLWLLSVVARRKKLKRFGDKELVRQLAPDVSRLRPSLKFWLLQAALALLAVCLARPQMGKKTTGDTRQGIETIIALDISNSMLAEDVAPSRLAKSKMLIENLVDRFKKDKVGMVVFAGDAFVQLPITSDYVSAKIFLQDISPSLIATQGTDIGQALNLSMHSFTKDSKAGKAIVLITDGEDHEGGAEEMAREAESRGIRVFILGIGSTKGAPIPTGDGGYLKDNTGQTVMTALNEQMCQSIAAAGKGTYIHVDNTNDAEAQLEAEITKIQKGDIKTVSYSDFDEQFQAVAILVALLLIAEVLVLEVKNSRLSKIKLFKKGK